MTKLYQKVYQLKTGSEHAMDVALNAGQRDAARSWEIRIGCYTKVLALLGDPEVNPTIWQKLICKVFHQNYNLHCKNCGGHY